MSAKTAAVLCDAYPGYFNFSEVVVKELKGQGPMACCYMTRSSENAHQRLRRVKTRGCLSSPNLGVGRASESDRRFYQRNSGRSLLRQASEWLLSHLQEPQKLSAPEISEPLIPGEESCTKRPTQRWREKPANSSLSYSSFELQETAQQYQQAPAYQNSIHDSAPSTQERSSSGRLSSSSSLESDELRHKNIFHSFSLSRSSQQRKRQGERRAQYQKLDLVLDSSISDHDVSGCLEEDL